MCSKKIKAKKAKCIDMSYEYKTDLLPELISKFMFEKSLEHKVELNDIYLNTYVCNSTQRCTLDVLLINKDDSIKDLETIDIFSKKTKYNLENMNIIVSFLEWIKENVVTENHETGIYWKYKGMLMDERVLFTAWLKNSY
jgi:hypothetical protein